MISSSDFTEEEYEKMYSNIPNGGGWTDETSDPWPINIDGDGIVVI